MNEIFCPNCNKSFDGESPDPGDSITCPNCGAEGYGSYTYFETDGEYDEYYTIEWY
jgi:hypothetical protein